LGAFWNTAVFHDRQAFAFLAAMNPVQLHVYGYYLWVRVNDPGERKPLTASPGPGRGSRGSPAILAF
jgi:hypothetical protein